MPHYVTAKREGGNTFHIFSTAVMAPITKAMNAYAMKKWLEEHEYTAWLDPRSWNEQNDADTSIPKWDPEGKSASQIASHERIRQYNDELTYWHAEGFWYVTEADGYFV